MKLGLKTNLSAMIIKKNSLRRYGYPRIQWLPSHRTTPNCRSRRNPRTESKTTDTATKKIKLSKSFSNTTDDQDSKLDAKTKVKRKHQQRSINQVRKTTARSRTGEYF